MRIPPKKRKPQNQILYKIRGVSRKIGFLEIIQFKYEKSLALPASFLEQEPRDCLVLWLDHRRNERRSQI